MSTMSWGCHQQKPNYGKLYHTKRPGSFNNITNRGKEYKPYLDPKAKEKGREERERNRERKVIYKMIREM